MNVLRSAALVRRRSPALPSFATGAPEFAAAAGSWVIHALAMLEAVDEETTP